MSQRAEATGCPGRSAWRRVHSGSSRSHTSKHMMDHSCWPRSRLPARCRADESFDERADPTAISRSAAFGRHQEIAH